MPHLSKYKLTKKTEKLFYEALISSLNNLDKKQIVQVLSTLLTKTEKIMLSKRLIIFLLLKQGKSYEDVSRATNTTRQTVARLRLQLLEISDADKKFVEDNIKKWSSLEILFEVIKKILDTPVKETIIRDLRGY